MNQTKRRAEKDEPGYPMENMNQTKRKVKQDEADGGMDNIIEINKNAKVKLCEGDIICDKDDSQLSKRGGAIKVQSRLWPNKVIPYKINRRFSEKEKKVIKAAMAEFHKHT
ncbi:uncharacterized protein LOC110232885 [Exaiptasia diaphana]|uniref:Peptidase M12A domain-containing protein n=1 Tax=Exaiptasia diaphana TaxID=2652724 RepID=A0A913WT75_EXADI|nr:uncharacterized protein LOC110232885 [Exaiptasia diaphana]